MSTTRWSHASRRTSLHKPEMSPHLGHDRLVAWVAGPLLVCPRAPGPAAGCPRPHRHAERRSHASLCNHEDSDGRRSRSIQAIERGPRRRSHVAVQTAECVDEVGEGSTSACVCVRGSVAGPRGGGRGTRCGSAEFHAREAFFGEGSWGHPSILPVSLRERASDCVRSLNGVSYEHKRCSASAIGRGWCGLTGRSRRLSWIRVRMCTLQPSLQR